MRPTARVSLGAILALTAALFFGCDSGTVGGNGGKLDSAPPPPPPGQDASPPGSEAGTPPGPCTNCKDDEVGKGTSKPFDPAGNESESVKVDPDGALVIDGKSQGGEFNKYLWVADTNLPGVVKIDTDTLKIVGRYRTGGSSTSRTTVNAIGEAFIGARSSGTQGKFGVTKILPHGLNCPDTNGDGQITTSTGPDDVLPYGQDDCVVWHTETDGDIRGLAAQDIPAVSAKEVCKNFKNGEFPPPTEKEKHYLWIGGLHGKIYKLDAETGKILLKITAPSPVYGMALSGDGRLWSANTMAFVDVNKCVDQTACENEPVCTQTCTATVCPNTCDNAIKAKYSGVSGYGITVDKKQRVWLSSGATKRYDPYGPVDQRLVTGANSGGGGIAADGNGWVWACNGSTTLRLDAETLQSVTVAAPNKGVAVDSKGRVFTVQNTGVHLITPGKTLSDYSINNNAVTLKGFAYAYSDMTGVQTRLASDVPGWYVHPFVGCDTTDTAWKTLKWDVEVPTGSAVIFSVRAADTAADLKNAAWVPVACVSAPGGADSANIETQKGKLLEVEVRFSAVSDPNTAQSVSARIKSFGVTHACGPIID